MRSLFIVFIALMVAPPTHAEQAAHANLTILSDESMLLPLSRIARAYAAETKTPITVVVKNAEDAQKQIEQGLEAHVLVTANHNLVARLAEQGLTDVTNRRPITRTELALVTASDLSKRADIAQRISFASILAATPALPVFVNDAATIEGMLAQRLLTDNEFNKFLANRLVTKPNHEEMLAALRDEDSLALMLAADAVAEPDMRVISLLDSNISSPVAFEAVVLGSESMDAARKFVHHLTRPLAQKIFADFGYQQPRR